jgi:hypothetical protein
MYGWKLEAVTRTSFDMMAIPAYYVHYPTMGLGAKMRNENFRFRSYLAIPIYLQIIIQDVV